MPQQNTQPEKNKNNALIPAILVSSICALIVSLVIVLVVSPTPKIAYVDTAKLMIGFNEAAKVDKELKEVEEEWKEKLKILQDSVAAHIEVMNKEYDKAPLKKKKELQTKLTIHNQTVNNFRSANVKKMQELQQEKMKSIMDKANLYLMEYGKKHNYNMIFGTATGGSILYGDQSNYDITEQIIKGLNERYK